MSTDAHVTVGAMPHAEGMNPITRPCVTLIAPVAAVAAVAAMTVPATASTPSAAASASSKLVHVDGAKDVQRASIDGETLSRAPGRKDADIRKVTVKHTAHRVVVTIRTRKAMPTKDFAVVETIRTPSRDFDVLHSNLFGSRDLELTRGARTISCDGLKAHRNRANRTVRLVVPTSCIGKPKRVRVGVGTIVMDGKNYFVDDGFASRAGDNLVRSRWIRRG